MKRARKEVVSLRKARQVFDSEVTIGSLLCMASPGSHPPNKRERALMNTHRKVIVYVVVLVVFTSLATPLYAQYCITRPTDAVSWWPFDESTGTTARDTVSGYYETHYNNPTPIVGLVDSALAFDGSDDYVKVLATPAASGNAKNPSRT
jgi:hypothetical protein